jgi:uncharacterized membrane-anchored protein
LIQTLDLRRGSPGAFARPAMGDLAIKVPVVITLYFWIIKILATTVGETGAELLIFDLHVGLGATSAIMGGLLVGLLTAQVRSRR